MANSSSIKRCIDDKEQRDQSSDEDSIDDKMFDPLNENANITLCRAYCTVMEFKRACRLPFTAIEKNYFIRVQ